MHLFVTGYQFDFCFFDAKNTKKDTFNTAQGGRGRVTKTGQVLCHNISVTSLDKNDFLKLETLLA